MADSMEIMEGGSTMLTATASRMVEASDGDVTVNLQVIGDGTLSAESITIAAGSDSGSVTLTATEDDDDYDDETVTVIASGRRPLTTIEIAVTDNDEAPVVSPAVRRDLERRSGRCGPGRDRQPQERGGSLAPQCSWRVHDYNAHVQLSELFDLAVGAVIETANAMTSRDEFVSAWTHVDEEDRHVGLGPSGPGSATITVTVGASAAGAETTIASVEFDVMVDTPALPDLTVTVACRCHDDRRGRQHDDHRHREPDARG